MASMKSLAKDTALYGISSILGKLLNWLLVPLYVVKVSDYEFGEITQLYAWTALLLVFLTYGLETGFFRFAGNQKTRGFAQKVYTTCMTSLGVTTILFLLLLGLFLTPLAGAMGFANHPEYLLIMGVIIAIDVMSALPFAWLRLQKKPLIFAVIKLLFIFINIGLNILFLVALPELQDSFQQVIHSIFPPDTSGVFYILLANLIASFIMMLALTPQFFRIQYSFDWNLCKKILRYSFPLLILGVAGIMNQTADKILFPMLVSNPATAKAQLGIYGANFKFAVVMIMFIQAFRFAYEPFVFAGNRSSSNTYAYVKAMKYFIIFGLFIFLGVGLTIDFLPHIPLVEQYIQPSYFSGLAVVPIVMMAEFFFGIFFNLSFWYKLTDKTKYGAYFSVIGCVMTILLNVLFVPHFGYMACAWTAFAVYFTMMVISYIMGQKYFPIAYEVKNGLFYTGLAVTLYALGQTLPIEHLGWLLAWRILLISIYVAIVLKKDMRQAWKRNSQK